MAIGRCQLCKLTRAEVLALKSPSRHVHTFDVEDPIPALRDAVVDAAKAQTRQATPDEGECTCSCRDCVRVHDAVRALLAAESAARSGEGE